MGDKITEIMERYAAGCSIAGCLAADIPTLYEALDQARRDRNSAVECAEVLRGYVAEGKAEIAKLRAERDEAVKWGEALSSRRFSDRNDHALRSRMEQSEAEVERLRKVEAAARDMLNFGAHDGPCSHEEEGGKCLLHVVTSKTRERALRAALDAAQGGG